LKKQLASGTSAKKQAKDIDQGDSAQQPKAGEEAASYEQLREALREAARALNVAPFEVPERVEGVRAEVARLEEQVAQLRDQGCLSADALLEKAVTVGDVQVVVCDVPGANPNLMRQLIDQVRKKHPHTAVLLATAAAPDKVQLVAGLSHSLVDRGLSAGQWVKQVASLVGGGGGGRPDMAQAGGRQPDRLPDALEQAKGIVTEMLEQAAS
jgi:alanyl-tRNA synthetase